MKLYGHQGAMTEGVEEAWRRGVKNVLVVMPTGTGKTVVFSHLMSKSKTLSVAIAHRKEILGQISMSLARNETPHYIVGPAKSARLFAEQQREELGRSWININARACVASVDTLLARSESLRSWGAQVGEWIQDEAHHVLKKNKWGKVIKLFPNARGLGVTATPVRADGQSLHHEKGGVFQELIQGIGQREAIEKGYLSDYKIFVAPSDLNLDGVPATPAGDFSPIKLAEASKNSHIVGDVVAQYLRIAPGEQGITFVTDVTTAEDTAERFKAAGVPAVALSATTSETYRNAALKDFRKGKLLQLVNVDLFGEGFDLPSLQVVSMARPTMSYGLYCQQFGRVLRAFKGKKYGKLIDHVGNVMRHGLPDRLVSWNLEQGKAPREDLTGPPLKTCEECLQLWEGYSRRCPWCDYLPAIAERKTIEQVEGDLLELDLNALRVLRGEVDRVDAPAEKVLDLFGGERTAASLGAVAAHRKRQGAQALLREKLALWGGHATFSGLDESARHLRFYREFGIDVVSAQALGKGKAEELLIEVNTSLNNFNLEE